MSESNQREEEGVEGKEERSKRESQDSEEDESSDSDSETERYDVPLNEWFKGVAVEMTQERERAVVEYLTATLGMSSERAAGWVPKTAFALMFVGMPEFHRLLLEDMCVNALFHEMDDGAGEEKCEQCEGQRVRHAEEWACAECSLRRGLCSICKRCNNLWFLSDPEKGVALCLALLVSSEMRDVLIAFHAHGENDGDSGETDNEAEQKELAELERGLTEQIHVMCEGYFSASLPTTKATTTTTAATAQHTNDVSPAPAEFSEAAQSAFGIFFK